MAEQRVLNSGKKSSVLRDAAALTTQLAAGLEKIGLAMKSRTWRREGRAGLGPLQRQVLTLLRSKPDQRATVSTVANELVVRLPTASEVIATLERKQLVRRRRDLSDGRVVTAQLTAKGNRSCHAFFTNARSTGDCDGSTLGIGASCPSQVPGESDS